MDHHFIFLMGLPRSGTTWIAKILDSHPRTVYLHEADRGLILRAMPLAPEVSEAETLRPMAETFVDGLLSMKNPDVVGSQPQFSKEFRSGLATKLCQLNIAVAKLVSSTRFKCPVFPMANYSEVSDLHVVWKSVGSIARVGIFARLHRKRHAIVLLRHPCGHVASMLRGEAQRKFVYPPSEDYGVFKILINTEPARRRGLTLDYITSLHPTERLAWRWLVLYEKALEDIRGVEGCTSVRYEDFCAEPERCAKQLMEFCGLSWNSATADFLKSSTATDNQKYYSVFKNPLRSAMRWQSDLSEEDIDRIYRVVEMSDLMRFYPRHDKMGAQADPNPETPKDA